MLVGTLKPSITCPCSHCPVLLPSFHFTSLPLSPLSCSPNSPLFPSPIFIPSPLPHSPFPSLLPLTPVPIEVVGILKPSIMYPCLHNLTLLSPSLPGPRGFQEAFGNLGASVSRALFPFAPLPHSPPEPLWAFLGPWGLRKSWEPSKAFSSLEASVRLRGTWGGRGKRVREQGE